MNDHDDILIALRRIIRAVDLHSKKLVKETGLTAPQLVVIQTLLRTGPLKPSALSREISLSQPTVTAILDRLERAGLVGRERSKEDRRAVLAALTDKGRAAAGSAPELLQSGFLSQFRELPTWEQHMLIAALQRISDLMDADSLDASPFLSAGEIEKREPAA